MRTERAIIHTMVNIYWFCRTVRRTAQPENSSSGIMKMSLRAEARETSERPNYQNCYFARLHFVASRKSQCYFPGPFLMLKACFIFFRLSFQIDKSLSFNFKVI